jgi:hypothetical protein
MLMLFLIFLYVFTPFFFDQTVSHFIYFNKQVCTDARHSRLGTGHFFWWIQVGYQLRIKKKVLMCTCIVKNVKMWNKSRKYMSTAVLVVIHDIDSGTGIEEQKIISLYNRSYL